MTNQRNALSGAISRSYGELVTNFASRELIDSARLAVAVVDAAGKVVAASDATPVANVEAVARACQERLGGLAPGEAAITNDPYSGGTRVQDHFVLAPVHGDDGALLGSAVVCAPFVDVGGMTLGNDVPTATDLWAEGVRTTPVRVRRHGRPDEDVLRLLKLNSRVPTLIAADAIVMCDVAERLASAAAPALADGTADALLAQERAALSERIGAAEGTTAEAVCDVPRGGDGADPRIQLSVAVSGGRIAVDLAGSAPQLDGSHLNATRHTTVTAVADAVRAVAGCAPSSAITDLLDVRCPERSIVNCEFPRPVGGSTQTRTAVFDAASRCLEQLLAGAAAH